MRRGPTVRPTSALCSTTNDHPHEAAKSQVAPSARSPRAQRTSSQMLGSSDRDLLALQAIKPSREQTDSVRTTTTLHRDGCSKNRANATVHCKQQWCRVAAKVPVVRKHPGSVVVTVARECQASSLQPPPHDTKSTPRATWHVRHIRHALLVQLQSLFVARRALCPSCHPHVLPSPRNVFGSSAPSPDQSDASATGQHNMGVAHSSLILWSHRFSLLLSRFTFSPAEEHSRGSTAARQTDCRSSQER